jgi:hypothetical protein
LLLIIPNFSDSFPKQLHLLLARVFTAELFTEIGSDAVAFGMEEGAYRFLAPAT